MGWQRSLQGSEGRTALLRRGRWNASDTNFDNPKFPMVIPNVYKLFAMLTRNLLSSKIPNPIRKCMVFGILGVENFVV